MIPSLPHRSFPRACFILGLVLSVAIRPPLRAQSPVFADTPARILRYIVSAHPDLPVQTSIDIAIIETNAPSYLAYSDKTRRSYRLNGLIGLEGGG